MINSKFSRSLWGHFTLGAVLVLVMEERRFKESGEERRSIERARRRGGHGGQWMKRHVIHVPMYGRGRLGSRARVTRACNEKQRKYGMAEESFTGQSLGAPRACGIAVLAYLGNSLSTC